MRRYGYSLFPALLVLIFPGSGCDRPSISAAPSQPAQSSLPVPLGFEPVGYFDMHCARCHGPYGSFYGADFGRKRTDTELRKVVAEMAEGPGGAPLAGAELDVQVAYQRSLIDGRPFLALTQTQGTPGEGLSLSGEVAPGSAVSMIAGGQSISAEVQGHQWTASLPAGTTLAEIEIRAEKEGKQTSIAPAQQPCSHLAALNTSPG